MARTLSEIFNQARQYRQQYLELTDKRDWQNSSKMSVLDTITWVQASCIWAFETILDVFKVDIAQDLNNRINGTPAYYAKALLKYQSGDELEMNEDGTAFSYPSVNEEKRIITKVSYAEVEEAGFHDKKLFLKIATGEPGAYRQIDESEMVAIRSYARQIAFAGTNLTVVSRQGDILIPRLTVYHDGAASEADVYQNIEDALAQFITNLDFNGVVYVQKILDAIQSAEHVVDVYINTEAGQGVYVAQFDDDNNLGEAQPVDRFFVPNSGYLKESTKQGVEANLPTWRESIILTVEENAL